MTRLLALAVALLAASLLGAGGGSAQPAEDNLHAKVGPGQSISLTDAAGMRVTKLDPGTYEIEVEDESSEHNFHLFGPGGVDRSTSVAGTGKETWTVTFQDGTYTFVCDPHSVLMKGSFTVGSGGQAPPSAGGGAVTPKTRLVLTSGPGFAITLKTAAGKPVKTMKTGTYAVSVRDRSRIHNARIVAPGYKRATTLVFVGKQSWKVKLAKPGTLRFFCDPHASGGMRGTAKIVR